MWFKGLGLGFRERVGGRVAVSGLRWGWVGWGREWGKGSRRVPLPLLIVSLLPLLPENSRIRRSRIGGGVVVDVVEVVASSRRRSSRTLDSLHLREGGHGFSPGCKMFGKSVLFCMNGATAACGFASVRALK